MFVTIPIWTGMSAKKRVKLNEKISRQNEGGDTKSAQSLP